MTVHAGSGIQTVLLDENMTVIFVAAAACTPLIRSLECEEMLLSYSGVDASPLMTWGTIEGTPFRLETDVIPTTGPSFKMPKISRREQVAMKLAEKAAKANKERKKAAMLAARYVWQPCLRVLQE